ncbi:RICIN domain-containing protein [Streptomyces rectiverticillatus]|uniref:RICIN domain-containing protein n=1 Tax=Streptomyces rectiverticillatus TaxID=173860 RepID=UPI0015C2F167|nr:RICIN domain-containing protein [Streptomyces rectiverticillatus]
MLTAAGTGQAAADDGSTLLVTTQGAICLEIENSSKSNGALAQQWSCKGQPGAEWKFVEVSGSGDDTLYQLVNVNSGKCLEIADSRTDYGAPIQQWTCVKGLATQQWRYYNLVLANNNGSYATVVKGDDGWASRKNGARVVNGPSSTWHQWDPADRPISVVDESKPRRAR